MCNILNEKCESCVEGARFDNNILNFVNRRCCSCSTYKDKAEFFGENSQNPCYFCGVFNKCSKQLEKGFFC